MDMQNDCNQIYSVPLRYIPQLYEVYIVQYTTTGAVLSAAGPLIKSKPPLQTSLQAGNLRSGVWVQESE